jgi:hypothetical protein
MLVGGMLWTSPRLRSITATDVAGTPPPSTSSTPDSTIPAPLPTLVFVATSPCNPDLAYGFGTTNISNFPPNRLLSLAAGFGDGDPMFFLRFTTDENGNAALAGINNEVPFTVRIRIWSDDNTNEVLDSGEELFLDGSVTADEPCRAPSPLVGVQ